MNSFIQDNDVMVVTAPYALTAGLGCKVGNIFGVAVNAAANGATDAVIKTQGIVDIAKTGSNTFAQGANVHWDNTAKTVTSVTTGNFLIGVAAIAVVSGDTVARVRLNGVGLAAALS